MIDSIIDRKTFHEKYVKETKKQYNSGKYETQKFREWLKMRIFECDPRISTLSIKDKHILYNIESGGSNAINRGKETQKYKKWLVEKEKKEFPLPKGNIFYIFLSTLKSDSSYTQAIYVIAKDEKEAIKIAKDKSKNTFKEYNPIHYSMNALENIEAKNLAKGWHLWAKYKE